MTFQGKTILIADDDPHLRDVLIYTLEKEHATVLVASDGKEAIERFTALQPEINLIVLDIMMPELDGLGVCREIRKTSHVPIVFLSSREDELDRILGLEIGGDDYITKPFSPREMVARIKVIFRRLEQLTQSAAAIPTQPNLGFTHGHVTLNPQTFSVMWQDQNVILTATEYHLLEILLRHPTQVLTRDVLTQADVFRDIVSDRTIDSHIRRLRAKFTALGCLNLVETVHGFGYRLGACS